MLLTVQSLLVVSKRADALLGRDGNTAKSRINQNDLTRNDIWCPLAGLGTTLVAQLRFKPK